RQVPSSGPSVAMRPSMTPMSARKTSDAVASVPLRTTRSYSAMIPPPRYSNGYSPDPRAASFPSHRKRGWLLGSQRSFPAMPRWTRHDPLLGDGELAAVGAFSQARVEAGQQPDRLGQGVGVEPRPARPPPPPPHRPPPAP